MLKLLGKVAKAAIVTMLQEVRVNSLEMNGKIEIFCKEIEAIKKIQAS